MRLPGLSHEIIFDEFEEYPVLTLNVFISSMLNMEMLFIPEYFPVKIYTSKVLYKQMRTYWEQKKVKCLSLHTFVILEANVPVKVPLDLSDSVEVCMFESEDINKNVIYMFRTDNKTTHVYAGVATEFRCLVFNNIFKDWILNGVGDLYVDISRAMCLDERNPRELNNAIDTVEEILDLNPDHILIINVLKFGYENFVYNLAERLRARVSIGGIMFAVFSILKKIEHFVPNSKDSKILIVNKCFTLEEMKSSFEKRKYIFFKITDKLKIAENNTCQQQRAFYELNWSPLPSDFDLQILARIVKPNRIYAIHHDSYAIDPLPEVPDYLLQLCKDYEQMVVEIKKKKNSEKKALEDIYSTNSSEVFSECPSNVHDNTMKMTQDDNANSEIERTKLVHDWLFSVNDENVEYEEETNIIQGSTTAPSEVTETRKTSRTSSKISKTLEKEQPISKSPKLSSNGRTYKKTFCIQKHCVQYLDSSESES